MVWREVGQWCGVRSVSGVERGRSVVWREVGQWCGGKLVSGVVGSW